MAEKKKAKASAEKENKDRARMLGSGMAKNAANAMIERKKKQRAVMKKLKLD